MTASSHVTLKKNVVYATHDGVPLYGDLYLPTSVGPHPAMMFIHGGAWKIGSKDGYGVSWGPYLAQRGYVVFAIDYRLATAEQHTWPQVLQDCKAGLQYMRGSAAELGINPDRIGVGGDSAGGQLSAMLALTQDWPAFANRYPNDRYADVSSKIKVVVTAYGVFNMCEWWIWTKKVLTPGNVAHTALEELFGGPPAELSAAYVEASPIEYVRGTNKCLVDGSRNNHGLKTPWFITWGVDDPEVPAEGQSIPFVKALRESRRPVTAVAVPNAGHFWFRNSLLTGQTGTPSSCVVGPDNFVTCAGATPNDFIAARLLEFLANHL